MNNINILFIIFLIFFIVFIIYYYNTKKLYYNIEKFENINELSNKIHDDTLTLYKNGYNFNENNEINYLQYPQLYDVHNREPLLTYACIKNKLINQHDNETVKKMIDKLRENIYISENTFYSISHNDIINNIIKDFDDVLLKSNEIILSGPIYVLIYQAPYLRFNKNEIKAKYNVINNLKPSYEQDNNLVKIGSKELYTKIYIMYPKYYKSYNDIKINKYKNDDGLKIFQNYINNNNLISRDKLCFMECNKNNKISCGCLNRSKSQNDNTNMFYESSCLEPDNNNNFVNYGMLYSINPYYNLFFKKISLLD